jgi:glycosidase
VFGAVQALASFPEWISGYYRVEGWQKGTPLQYLQFVVIAVPEETAANIQIRYLLAGTDVEPFRIDNAKFVFVGKEEPLTGQWVSLTGTWRRTSEQLWGGIPEDLTEVRVFFEARYDSRLRQPQMAETFIRRPAPAGRWAVGEPKRSLNMGADG